MSLTAKCRDCDKEVSLTGNPQRFAQHDLDDGRECPGTYAFVAEEVAWEQQLESRFTRSRPDCPHPERWHSRDQDSAETEVRDLVAAFVRALRPDVVVETGTAWAYTAGAIASSLGRTGVLHTVEPDPVRAEYSREALSTYDRVHVHECKSLDWTPPEGCPPIGFAWLDSLIDLRVKEFLHLKPYMAPGSFVGFHDVGPQFGPQLRRDIEQLEAEGHLLPVFLPTPRGVCFAEVT